MEEQITVSFRFRNEDWTFSFSRKDIAEASKVIACIMDFAD